MSIAKITGPGLAAMAVSVALLWGCWIAEQVLWQRAAQEQVRVLRDMQLLRQRQNSEPTSAPIPRFWHKRRTPAG